MNSSPRPETVSVITAAPARRRSTTRASTVLLADATVLAALQFAHALRFGWLYTLYWWLGIAAGWAVVAVIRRTA